MVNADGIIVLTFNFNSSFAAGQAYVLPAGAVFGFTDGKKYVLDKDYTFTYDGSNWSMEAVEVPEKISTLELTYRWGIGNLIQMNTNLPSDTPLVNFTASDNGCEIDQTKNQYQQVAWIGMDNADGTIVLTFHFNSDFAADQTYVLPAGAVFGFTDGKKYALDKDYTFNYDGSNWTMTATGSVMIGDLNEDNLVDVLDLILMKKAEAGILPVTEQNDIVNDGVVDHWDLMRLRRIILGITEWDDSITQTVDYLLDPLRFQGGEEFITFADIPVDSRDPEKVAEYKALGFDTSLVTEDYTPLTAYRVTCEKSDAITVPEGKQVLTLEPTGYTNGKMIQIKTNLPTDGTYSNFLLGQEGYALDVETAQTIGWFQFYSDTNAGAVFFNPMFNDYYDDGETYILKAGSSLKVDDTEYALDCTYTFTIKNDYLASIKNLDNAGLKVWIRNHSNKSDYFTDDVTKILKKYDGVIDGFYMADEPFESNELLTSAGQTNITTDFAAIAEKLVPWLNINFPNTCFHVNQVPMTSYDHYTGEQSADNYAGFFSKYNTSVLANITGSAGKTISTDCYPFVQKQTNGFFGWGATSGILKEYLQSMLIAAKSAKDYNASSENGKATFGMCIQTFEATSSDGKKSRDITKAEEVSLQLYTGMALGAKQFEYFTYNSGSGFDGIMNSDGTRRIYDLVRTANKNALCFADVVNNFTWQGIVTSNGTSENANKASFKNISGMVLSDADNGVLSGVTSTHDAVVGCFTKDSRDGYLVVNYNDPVAVTGNNSITVTFDGCTKARVYTSSNGTLKSQIVDLVNGSYTCSVAPGSACFVIPV